MGLCHPICTATHCNTLQHIATHCIEPKPGTVPYWYVCQWHDSFKWVICVTLMCLIHMCTLSSNHSLERCHVTIFASTAESVWSPPPPPPPSPPLKFATHGLKFTLWVSCHFVMASRSYVTPRVCTEEGTSELYVILAMYSEEKVSVSRLEYAVKRDRVRGMSHRE